MFDIEALKANAITSIRLGIEDFAASRNLGGDPDRALSALRNLYAGILLLFKYRIVLSVSDSDEGRKLIFEHRPVRPVVQHDQVVWDVDFKPTTIDLTAIKERFDMLKIKVDWTVVETLQKERNYCEHLHPQNTAGVIADFVARSFPLLDDFIRKQLDEQPTDLLGATWQLMLNHHDFYQRQLAACQASWRAPNLPADIVPLAESLHCDFCGSALVLRDEDASGIDNPHYVCVGCNHHGEATEQLESALLLAEGYDPYRGSDECPVLHCDACGHETLVDAKQRCLWCGQEFDYTNCLVCDKPLSHDEQDLDGLCGYHAYTLSKAD
ncbi:hypothetical protein [Ralstonia syzygii]|uniref:hypothetical protein n=1 Tax=Ralstonia syzygii TaxID=28097 RepID=UPI0018D140FF